MIKDLKKHFSNLEWKNLEKAVEETFEGSGISKDELLSRMAEGRIAEQKSTVAACRVLEKYGWDKELAMSALETSYGEEGRKAIQKLAEELWYELGVYDALKNKGVTHPSRKKILPISLIKYLASRLLETMLAHEGKVPVPLIFLIRDLLDARGYGHNLVRAPHQEKLAIFYLAEDKNRTASDIAKLVEINKSTVTRWLQDPDFMARADRLRADEYKFEYLSWALGNGQFPLSDWE